MSKALRKTIKISAWVIGIGAVLLLILYFALTSQWFICSQVLPRVSQSLGTPVTVERISVSPFSAVELSGFQVGDGQRPLARLGTLRCRYSLWAILGGELKVTELLLADGKIQLVQDAAGKWNLPQFPQAASAPAPAQSPTAAKPGTPPRLNVTNVRVQNLEVVLDKAATASSPAQHLELKGVTVSLPKLRGGSPVQLEWSGTVAAEQAPLVAIKSGEFGGSLTAELGADLLPRALTLNAKAGKFTGTVQGIDLAPRQLAAEVVLQGDPATKLTLQKCRFEVSNGPQPEAAVALTGSVTLKPLKVEMDMVADPITSSALNLAGGFAGGLHFGQTMARYIGRVIFSEGSLLESRGKLAITQLSVTSPKLDLPPSPAVDVVVEHDATINLAAGNAKVTTLLATVKQADNELLALRLSEPLTLAWGGNGTTAATATPAKINLAVKSFSLPMISPFIPASAPVKLKAGELQATLLATIGNLGRDIAVTGEVTVRNLAYMLDGTTIEKVAVRETLDLTLTEFRQLKLNRQAFELIHDGKAVLTSEASATLDLQTLTGTVEASVPLCNQGLLALAPLPPSVTGLVQRLEANAKLTARLSEKGRRIAVTGAGEIPVLEARLPDGTPVPPLQTALQYDLAVDLDSSTATITTVEAKVREGGRQVVGLTLSTPATVNWSGKAGSNTASPAALRLLIDRFNLALANPFLAAAKAEISSGSVSGELQVTVADMGRDLQVKGRVTGTDIGAKLPQGAVGTFGFTKETDARLRDFRQLELTKQALELTVTGEAALRVNLQGKFDLHELAGEVTVDIPVCNQGLLALVPLPADVTKLVQRFEAKSRLTARVSDKGRKVAVTGSSDIPVLEARLPDGTPVPPLQTTLQYDVAADLDAATATIKTLQAKVLEKQRQVVGLTLSAPATFGWGGNAKTGAAGAAAPAELHLVIDRFSLALANPFLAAAQVEFPAGTLNGDISVTVAGMGKDIQAKGQLTVADAQVKTAATGKPLAVKADFGFDVGQRDGREIRIRTCTAKLGLDQRDVLNAGITGRLFLPPMKEESVLDITAGDIDLKILADIFAPLPAAGSAPPPPSTPAPQRGGGMPTTEPPPIKLDGIWATANLNVRSLTYGDIRVAPLTCTAQVRDNVITIKPLALTLNETPVQTDARADVGVAGYEYQMNTNFTKPLDLAPFIRTFAPTLSNQVSGSLKTFTVNASGRGITPANLSRHAAGEFLLETGPIVVENLPAALDVAAVLGLPDLRRIQLDRGIVRLRPEDGVLKIAECSIEGPEVRLDLLGQFWFDLRQKVDVQIGLSQSTEERMIQRKIPTQYLGTRSGGFLMLEPVPALRGTVLQPEICDYKAEIKRLVVEAGKKAIKTAGMEALGQVLQGGKVDSKKLLQNVLTPQALPRAETPAAGTGSSTHPPGTGTTAPATTPPQAAPAKPQDTTGQLLNSLLGGGNTTRQAPATTTPPPAGTTSGQQLQPASPPPAPAEPQPAPAKKKKNALMEIGVGALQGLMEQHEQKKKQGQQDTAPR